MKPEEHDLSITLMVFHHYAAKMLESAEYFFFRQTDQEFYFRNPHTTCVILIEYRSDNVYIHGASASAALTEKLMENDLFQLMEEAQHTLNSNLKIPLQNLWSLVRVHFSDEEVLKIFAHDFGRTRYLKDSRKRRTKCEEAFFTPPEHVPSTEFI